jgi:predicted permease
MIGDENKGSTLVNQITPGYFRTLGIGLLAGRDFNDRDTVASPRVAVANELFAERILEEANPIGATFRFQAHAGEVEPPYEIVGLVKNTKYNRLRDEFKPIVYLAAMQDEDAKTQQDNVLLRSSGPVESLFPAVSDAVGEVSPAISIRFRVLKTQIHESLMGESLMATLSGFFGLLAVLLATVGLYGVMSYMVAQRRNEIGIRMALGAGRGSVVAMVLREAGWLLGIGLTAGIALALGAARAASGMLFGLEPNDPATLLMAAAGLAAVAIVASYLPARRAANLDPTVALREE